MRTRPPNGPKPGAGLGHLFPTEEPKTAKVPTLASESDPKVLCPACDGELHVHMNAHEVTSCPTCSATGSVAQAIFDQYVADHPNCPAAKQLAAKSGNSL